MRLKRSDLLVPLLYGIGFAFVPLLLSIVSPTACAQAPAPVSLLKSGPNAPTVTIYRDDRVATLELDYVAGNPWTPFDIGDHGLGPVGYRVTWFRAGQNTEMQRKVTALRRTQIQPLENNQRYRVRVHYVNRFGELVGDYAYGSFSGGNGGRVKALREQMTGFFDDFNSPAGLPDELKWNTAFSKINDPNLQAFFINSQFHSHTLVGTLAYGYGDRGQTVHRIRNPLRLGPGELRRIVFDLDGVNVGARSVWYLDLLKQEADITSHVTVGGGPGGVGGPSPGLRFSLVGQEVALYQFNSAGEQILIEKNGLLDFEGVQTLPNVRRPMEIQLSEQHVTMLIDGQIVLDSELGDAALSAGDYTVHWNAFGYNTMKVAMPYFLLHWDNFGFDGPPPQDVVHNYRTQVMGTDYVQSDDYQSATVSIDIPDELPLQQVGGTGEARLVFTRQMADWQAAQWNESDRVIVNSVAYPIPAPVSTATPPLSLEQMINVNAPYSTSLSLGTVGEGGTAPLVQGLNDVTFEAAGCGFHNVHIEVRYPRGSEPTYTPPQQIHPIPLHHDFPKVGLPARITRIADVEVDRNVWHMDDPANFNTLVSGIVDVGAVVNGDEFYGPTTLSSNFVGPQLASSGENPGICCVELWIRPEDGNEDSATLLGIVFTDQHAPAPQFIHSFEFDSTEFSNGVYELTLLAEDSLGVLSIPDFGGVGRDAGSPEALNGYYFPLHITIDN